MQSGDMPVAKGFIANAFGGNFFNGQRNFDEFGHRRKNK
jgi:hypothetical protein